MIAHRGESYLAPENTLAAMDLAWSLGAAGVEFDLRLTRDDRLVVCHDATTKKVADQDLVIRDQPLERLGALDVGRWKGRQWAGQRMPTFEQVLASAPQRGQLFIEIKDGPEAVPPVIEVLQASTVDLGQCVVVSFDQAVIGQVKASMAAMQAYWTFTPTRESSSKAQARALDQTIDTAQSIQADGLFPRATEVVDASYVKTVHQAGLTVPVWTVDAPDHARALLEANVDEITTNRAAWLKAQLEDPRGPGTV